jgi:hypothetical protein
LKSVNYAIIWNNLVTKHNINSLNFDFGDLTAFAIGIGQEKANKKGTIVKSEIIKYVDRRNYKTKWQKVN